LLLFDCDGDEAPTIRTIKINSVVPYRRVQRID
jgi:hypothetical protein